VFTDLNLIAFVQCLCFGNGLLIDLDLGGLTHRFDNKSFAERSNTGVMGLDGKAVDRNSTVWLAPDQAVPGLQCKNLEFAAFE